MRDFISDYRIGGYSVAEISHALERVTLDLSQRLEFNRRKLKPGPMLNALALYFCELPEDVRTALADRALARMELVLAETEEERALAEERLKQARIAAKVVFLPDVDEGRNNPGQAPNSGGGEGKPKSKPRRKSQG